MFGNYSIKILRKTMHLQKILILKYESVQENVKNHFTGRSDNVSKVEIIQIFPIQPRNVQFSKRPSL